jgi:hypothetical protein
MIVGVSCQIGELRAQRALGVSALYRVVDVEQDHVRVEVVRAPGLAPGLAFRFTAAAVEAMDIVDASAQLDQDLMAALARWAA